MCWEICLSRGNLLVSEQPFHYGDTVGVWNEATHRVAWTGKIVGLSRRTTRRGKPMYIVRSESGQKTVALKSLRRQDASGPKVRGSVPAESENASTGQLRPTEAAKHGWPECTCADIGRPGAEPCIRHELMR